MDLKYFERNLFWTDVFDGEKDENFKPNLFRERKTNFSRRYNPPDGLKTFISSVKSDLRDPDLRNRNLELNLTSAEKEAESELILLQKNRILTVTDKGSCIILMDTPDYVKSCNEHLNSSLKLDDGTQRPYYRKVEADVLEQAKSEISACLDKAHKAGIISDHEYKHMDPSEKVAGRFYALPKVHKHHEPGQVPPLRPIISGSGSITECISQYVQDKIKDFSKLHPAWLEDTPHLLRELDPLDNLPDTAVIVTVDISSLYSSIQREDGVEAVRVRKVLETRKDKSIPSDFILELLDLVLKFNIFEYDSQIWQQLIGTAMGGPQCF